MLELREQKSPVRAQQLAGHQGQLLREQGDGLAPHLVGEDGDEGSEVEVGEKDG